MEPALQFDRSPTRCLVPREAAVRRRPAAPGSPGMFYEAVRLAWRICFACTMRVKSDGLERTGSTGGLLIAVSHAGHLDPVVVSLGTRRRIGWMSRQEFFDSRLCGWVLQRSGAFPVRRRGCAAGAIKESLRRLERGEAVGIFPEGEVMRGADSVVHGGRIRHGVAYLAAKAGCPVLPVVVAGTDRLSAPGPWLPAKRGRLWMRAGDFLHAPSGAATRSGRAAFAEEIECAFRSLYRDLCAAHDLPPDAIP